MLAELDRISIAGGVRRRAAGAERPGERHRRRASARASARRLRDAIAARGVDYVGQEVVRLSTTPRWEEDRLEPRPFVLRVYAAATPDGWRVMPGGFCRISDQPDARAVSMGDGVESADVWVLAESPVEASSLLPTPEKRPHHAHARQPAEPRGRQSVLVRPLSRTRGGDAAGRALPLRARGRSGCADAPRPAIARAADGRAGRLGRGRRGDGRRRLRPPRAAWRCAIPTRYGSALSLARSARNAASVIRERLTHQTWQLIGRLETHRPIAPRPRRLSAGEIVDVVDEALTTIAALVRAVRRELQPRRRLGVLRDSGAASSAASTPAACSRQFAGDDATEHTLDVLLDLIDSQITYRSRTLIGVALAPVRDMALLDPFNPRSVAFQVNRIDEHIATLPVLRQDGIPEEPMRLDDAAQRGARRRERRREARRLAHPRGRAEPCWRSPKRSPPAISCKAPRQGRAEKVMGLA